MTEEDLPPVDTPTTFNVSPLGSFAAAESQPQEEPPSSPGMPVTKVQPFLTGETADRMMARPLPLRPHPLRTLLMCVVVDKVLCSTR